MNSEIDLHIYSQWISDKGVKAFQGILKKILFSTRSANQQLGIKMKKRKYQPVPHITYKTLFEMNFRAKCTRKLEAF